ncbi:transcription factor AP-2-delta-like [Scleropages formosus]|uniref:Transcription factor AP-2-delta-like n=1 Tax=Scleropages formosus TaxID=113540 RepID=A0A0P7WQY7_SCLFO|nr:transcription factor AP-2-delta-like [Scleropages formosus]
MGKALVAGVTQAPVEVVTEMGEGQESEQPTEVPVEQGSVPGIPFAQVASLLDPNMKSSKALKYQIHYNEVKRRLESPEKMSLRSLAAYTRVSRGPASRKALLEMLNSFGLSPSTTTAVSSSFSKLTEGDTAALCKDMREFASQYMDYDNVAKQLVPETNQVQHWSKIIETRNHLEEMRKCFHDPENSRTFNNATHGFGAGMIDVAFDMINRVIEKQIRILSGEAEPKEAQRENRVRKRRARAKTEGKSKVKNTKARKDEAETEKKTRAKVADRKRAKADPPQSEAQPEIESSVLTLVSVGYETISSGLEPTSTGVA